MDPISFRVLGPLEVTVAGQAVPLGGRKPRSMLATLLLEPNGTVDVDTLVDVLWPEAPPRSAVANLRTYAHSLRAGIGARVGTRPGGYRISVEANELDMTAFETKAAQGQLDEANALWRGRALADLPRSPVWEPTLARLEELRLSVIERSVLNRTSSDSVIPELRGLLAEYPLREELWRHLILALRQHGRDAEALQAYQEAEQVLAAELGTRPGPALRQVRDEINTSVFPVCQLPMDIPDFTGRAGPIRAVEELLRGPTPVVVVLNGAPGSGKSTLAVHIGHRSAGLFPDGQLHVPLRPDVDPFDVLAYLLTALGIPDLPDTIEGRAARYRSVLARRRMLVVLDGAVDAGQITPLLPGSGGSAVLVTSRGRLPDLPGAVAVPIDMFSNAEARELLARIAGHRRISAEPEQVTGILRACGNLPLAIRVAGTKLAMRPRLPLRVTAERLRDERGRLDELTAGSLAVRTSVTDSYERLSPVAARAFRLAGMLGPVSFPGWVMAALLDRPHADDVLDTLVDSNLVDVAYVDQSGATRYRLPSLFRCYADERLTADPSADLREATRRVLAGYSAMATHAADRMPVRFFGVLPRQGVPTGGSGDPVGWFETERPGVLAVLDLAERLGIESEAWRIPAVYTPYFDLRGQHDDWQRTHDIALRGARQAGDRHGEAIILRNIGQLDLYQDRYPAAETALRQSLRLFTEAGDDCGTGIALSGIGTSQRVRGEYKSALATHRRALKIFLRAGEPHLEAAARLSVGIDLLALQDFPAAEPWLTSARSMSAGIYDRHREAHALQQLAWLRGELGDSAQAFDHLDEATDMFQNLGDEHCIAYAHQHTGELCLRTGDRDRAQALLTKSLDAHLRSGDQRSAAEVTRLLETL